MTHRQFIGKMLRWMDNSVFMDKSWDIYHEAHEMYRKEEYDEFTLGYLVAVQNLVHTHMEISLGMCLLENSGISKEEFKKAQLRTNFENEEMIDLINRTFNS